MSIHIIYDQLNLFLISFTKYASLIRPLPCLISGAYPSQHGQFTCFADSNSNLWHQIIAELWIIAVIELDDGKIYRKDLYLMVKTMVSCRFSLKPIHWCSLKMDIFLFSKEMDMQTQLGDVWILGMPFFRGLAKRKSGWKMLDHGQNLFGSPHYEHISVGNLQLVMFGSPH